MSAIEHRIPKSRRAASATVASGAEVDASRRTFLKTGGSLVVTFALGGPAAEALAA